jgi:membrane protease YdiL (CAAX protease family)
MFTTIVAIIFTLILIVGIPALSHSTAHNPKIAELTRLDLYLSAVISQWMLGIAGIGIVYWILRSVFVKGFATMPLPPLFEWTLGISFIALLSISVVLWCERQGWIPTEPELVYRLMPQTAQEKLWAVLIVSPTAAFCEEFLFRGYLLAQLEAWLHSLLWAWIVASVAFGLAHFYQSWGGMIRAGLLGALLACPVLVWGNLYPSMLAHWIIDSVALLWLGRWMVKQQSPSAIEPARPVT